MRKIAGAVVPGAMIASCLVAAPQVSAAPLGAPTASAAQVETRFAEFAVAAGSGTVTAGGRLVTANGAGVPRIEVHLQHSRDGVQWKTVHIANGPDLPPPAPRGRYTDADGEFTMKYRGAVLAGHWRAALLKDPAGVHLPSRSHSVRADGRAKAKISRFNASPEPVRKGRRITVSGTLREYPDGPAWSWITNSPYLIRFYFRRKGSSSWSYKGKVESSQEGYFRLKFTAKRDGSWRVAYRGSDRVRPVTGKSDYVDVR